MSMLQKMGFTHTPKEPTINVTMPEPAKEPEVKPQPLDDATKWFTPEEGDHKDTEFDPTKLFGDIDPKQLSESFKGLNMVQSSLTPELASRIKEGGEDSIAAVVELMNATSQKSVEASTQMAAALVKKALAESAPHVDQRVSSGIRNQNMESAIKEASPVFQNPAMSFMVDKLKEVFTAKYPNATPAEWRDKAAKFAAELGNVATPAKAEPTPATSNDTDWNSFIERVT